jgi:medium-chain acyl-[acyl-carrier-protein] hydrolase
MSLGAVEVWPVLLPAREQRLAEPPLDDILQLAAAAAEGLAPELRAPFAFFGHSMGAILAFEVARYLRRARRPGPMGLAVSGYGAPHIRLDRHWAHDMPTLDFLEQVRDLNGTPKEVFEADELLSLLLPMLRADFKAVETYRYIEEPPLDCAILAYGGRFDDEITEEQILASRVHTSSRFVCRMFDGDHFYINSQRTALIGKLAEDLRQAADDP